MRVCLYPQVSIRLSLCTCACMFLSVCLSVNVHVFLSVCMHMKTRVSISFLPLCTCACMRKAAFDAHFDVSTQRSISSSESSSYICLCEKARLTRALFARKCNKYKNHMTLCSLERPFTFREESVILHFQRSFLSNQVLVFLLVIL